MYCGCMYICAVCTVGTVGMYCECMYVLCVL